MNSLSINSLAKGVEDYTQEELLIADANKDGIITTVDVGIINSFVKSAA